VNGMRLLVVGGKLQGVEACYLARRAGWTTILVDRSPRPPASGLCDEFHHFDITRDERRLRLLARNADAVLPALEDSEALGVLERFGKKQAVRVFFDFEAFHATGDKLAFQRRFEDRLLMPALYPCPPPFVVKSRRGSGSHGVRRAEEISGGDPVVKDDDLLVQRYVEGEHWSMEAIRSENSTRTYVPTILEFDRDYSCCRVVVPERFQPDIAGKLVAVAEQVAEGICLSGLMDVQCIRAADGFYLLEVNARLPSQTPMAVFHAGGVNLLCELVETRGSGRVERAVLLEHVEVRNHKVSVRGESVISTAGPLKEEPGRWGTETTLTDIHGGEGVATLVFTGSSLKKIERRRVECFRRITGELEV